MRTCGNKNTSKGMHHAPFAHTQIGCTCTYKHTHTRTPTNTQDLEAALSRDPDNPQILAMHEKALEALGRFPKDGSAPPSRCVL